MVFTIFCILVDEKIKLKVLIAPLKVLTNFENSLSNPLQRQSGTFDTENAFRKPPVIM